MEKDDKIGKELFFDLKQLQSVVDDDQRNRLLAAKEKIEKHFEGVEPYTFEIDRVPGN